MFTLAKRWIGVRSRVGPLVIAICDLLPPAQATSADLSRQVWDFNADVVQGAFAKGFSAEIGSWTVATETGTTNQVLAQTVKSPRLVLNIAVVADANRTDVDLSARVKPVAGIEDQGGDVWRFKDVKNYYYAALYNSLEDNYRLCKVVDGKRTQLATADVPGDQNWHTVRVAMKGTKIACAPDGKTWLKVDDAISPTPARSDSGPRPTPSPGSTI